ncbi:MAG: TPM domain-containing protein [Acidobacteria bacterium]|nr:TPM domain-containing protein [Acidobacteriota bacterium]
MRRTSLWTLALAAMVILPAGAVAALEVPYLSGRVNDLADLISGDAEARIVDSLEDFENRTGHQVAVLTIPSLEGEVLEKFSLRVSETWGLGRSEQDDGVLLLVARDDRKMRIEVGYGLEADLTDAESGRILRNILTPRFKAGDFDGGIEQGVAAIVGTLEGREVIPRETSRRANDLPIGGRLLMGGMFLMVVGMFSLIAIFTSGCQSWFLYVFLVPFWGAFPMVFLGPRSGLIALVGWVIGAPILKLLFGNTKFGKRWVKSHPGWTTWTSGSGGGWSSGGGGGFSGGGGSFGGGGASGSW